MSNADPATAEVLSSNDLSLESRFYRYTLTEYLAPAGDEGETRVSANSSPDEAVIDVYNDGVTLFAKDLAPGLVFAASRECEWESADRVCIEIRVGDVLEEGGRLYPVQFVENAWYLTFPSGSAAIRKL